MNRYRYTEHFDPDDPLFDPEDENPSTDTADLLHLWDEPEDGD